MQMMEAVVSRDQAPVVEFRGEGGECITVTLQADQTLPDVELVAKAKVMMVQVARFGMDQTEGSATTDGSPAEQIYTLEYQDKGQLRSVGGLSFLSLDAVAAECRRSAEDLWQDALSRGEAPIGWAVRARDAQGVLVASVDFAELQRESADQAGVSPEIRNDIG